MSKIRHPVSDRSVWIRTYPITYLHDVTERRLDLHWHQLTFAVRGQLEVITEDARRFVPVDRAVWIPAGVQHTTVMRAPISMRSLFVAARLSSLASLATRVRTLQVTPLLRELILHVVRIGALDCKLPEHARLARVLLDQLALARDAAFELPSPNDPRARRVAELVLEHPEQARSLAELARRAGASLRTIERCFLAETGLALGAWRRLARLFHAQRLLGDGKPLGEVALAAGYANASAFGYAFRRQFGHAPSGRGSRASARAERRGRTH